MSELETQLQIALDQRDKYANEYNKLVESTSQLNEDRKTLILCFKEITKLLPFDANGGFDMSRLNLGEIMQVMQGNNTLQPLIAKSFEIINK